MNLKREICMFILQICPLLVYGKITIRSTGTQIIGEKLVLTCTISPFTSTASWAQDGTPRSTCTSSFCTVSNYGNYTTFTVGNDHINVTFDPVHSSIDGMWECTHVTLGSANVTVIAMNKTLSSRGTNTPTEKDEIPIGPQAGCLVIAYIIVIAMVALRIFIRSTEKRSGKCFLTFCLFIEENFFDCCGNKNSQELPKEECFPRTTTPFVVVKGDPDFFKDKVLTLNSLLGFTYLVLYGAIVDVIVLSVVYYLGYYNFQVTGKLFGVGFAFVSIFSGLCLLVVVWMLMKYDNNDASKNFRLECCISLMSDTVTPHDRQQPDGDEGIQSTPTEIHTRLSTTPRPLPPRPDIASKPQGTLDSLNSHIPIVLAPIENPNIPPSIDTLDEQKTDKKPKDKKKKKKKKKDVEQDNPGTGQ